MRLPEPWLSLLSLDGMKSGPNDAVARFASDAIHFREWARGGIGEGELGVREALIRVTTLYLAALPLPLPWSEEFTDQPNATGIEDGERYRRTAAFH